MPVVREARIFRNGRNQAVRIPKELELNGDSVTMWREGNRLIIEQKESGDFDELIARLKAIEEEFPDEDDEFPEIEDLPPEPVEL